jgi:hypothetical protein
MMQDWSSWAHQKISAALLEGLAYAARKRNPMVDRQHDGLNAVVAITFKPFFTVSQPPSGSIRSARFAKHGGPPAARSFDNSFDNSLAQKMLNKRHFASQPPYRATIDA